MAFEFTDKNTKELIETGQPVVIDFWAEWCGPCRRVAPRIEELAGEYEGKVLIGKCDIEDAVDTANEFDICTIPTIVYIRDGEVKDRQVGSASKADIKARIEKLMA